MDWAAWCEPAPEHAGTTLSGPGYWGVLAHRTPEWYADRLSAQGISSDVPIVVYADGPRSKGRDGRIAWMLLYLGAQSVSLLDGGWQAWRRIGETSERIAPRTMRGRFVVDVQTERRCTRSELLKQANLEAHRVLVDTRTPAEFEGDIYRYQPRRGHLPAAISIPFATLFLPSKMYVDTLTYADRIPREVRQATDIVAYCEVGVRACVFALLHEIHTGQIVQVYDGSMIDWSLDLALPVHTGR